MAGTILPQAVETFVDANGKPLAGGSVYMYIPNTTTFKNTWQDPAQTILNTNPIILNASGQAIIWGTGSYRQQVFDANNNLIWDQVTEDTTSGLLGNMTDDTFVAGTDFTPGTTAALTLSVAPGSLANTWIYFDGVYQADNSIASLNGTTLTFNAPIPVGTQLVTVKIGSTIAIGTPGSGTVGLSQLVFGNYLNRVVDSISALKGINISSAQRAFVTGYYAAGDGGGGPYSYSASTSQSLANDGTIVAASGGVGCWILQSNGPISVKQFGAKGDGVNDDAPPIQACITAVADTWIPDGTYLFNSTNAAPIPATNAINVLIQSKNGFSVRCSPGATFVCSDTANDSCMFGFWKCQDFVFDGPVLEGNRTGISAGTETVGIVLMSVVNFQVKNVHLSGNWGDSGTAFGGDWWVNGLIENVQADQIGQGFDVAFLQNVTFRRINVFGFSIVTGGAGNAGFNTSYDTPLVSYNFTGVSFTNTNHVYFEEFVASNFNVGALFATGSFIYFDSKCNFNNNQGTTSGSIQGFGVVITYNNGGSFSSVGFPCNHFYFNGTKFENNGLLVNGSGVLISGAAITNGDVISDIVFEGCNVYNNGNTGIETTGEANLLKIVIQNCQFTSGGSQANAIVGLVINAMNSSSLPNAARITDNFGFNPAGFFGMTLPGGTGSGNTITNTYSYYVKVFIYTQAFSYVPNIVQPGGTTITLGIVSSGSAPCVIDLPPGYGIYFTTAVPASWEWMGL